MTGRRRGEAMRRQREREDPDVVKARQNSSPLWVALTVAHERCGGGDPSRCDAHDEARIVVAALERYGHLR